MIDAEWIREPIEEIAGRVRSHLDRILAGELSDYTCVALVADQVVGYGKCALVDWSRKGVPELPQAWYLTGVTVARAYRRQGIGTRVIEHRLDWLSERANEVHFFTGEPNRVSQDLHARFGFVRVGPRFKLPGGSLPEEWNLLFRKSLVSHREEFERRLDAWDRCR